ncbi:CHAT domain-containing protein [Nocardia sp. NPDC051756]|uniref:CHAT domain-containing protein n=1 Tax=Nocardia sp. NPDC051756 TaxID=3154751 RepID=UPI0034285E39
MFAERRVTRAITEAAESGDAHALDRAVHLQAQRDNTDPAAAVDQMIKQRHPIDTAALYRLGLAWFGRATEITRDAADLERALTTLDQAAINEDAIALDAMTELAFTLVTRFDWKGDSDDIIVAVSIAEAAVAQRGNDGRPGFVLAAAQERAALLRATPTDLQREPAVSLPGDNRQAIVLTATSLRRTRRLVVIAPDERAAGLVEPDEKSFFKTVWSEADPDQDTEVLLVIAAEGLDDEFLVAPYLPPEDGIDLAADALHATGTPVEVRGPYRVPWSIAVAYVLTGHFSGQTRRMAIATTTDEHPVAINDLLARTLFYQTLAPSARIGSHWIVEPPVPAFEWPEYPEPLASHEPTDLAPSEFATAVLTVATTFRADGLNYRWIAPDNDYGNQVNCRRDPDEPWSVGSVEFFPPSAEWRAWQAANWDVMQQESAESYLREAIEFAQQSKRRDAFRMFSLHRHLYRPDTADAARWSTSGALAICETLYHGGLYDLAEWAATSSLPVAKQFGDADTYRFLLRYAAIAAEAMTQRDTALEYYAEAFSLEEPFERPLLERDLHLDFVTTTLNLMADHEAEELYRAPFEPVAAQLLRRAAEHLEQARTLVAAESVEASAWARSAIAVYTWRLRDLAGEHEAAADGLTELLDDPALRPHGPLTQSALVFRLMALCKLADQDPAWHDRYDRTLDEQHEISAIDRRCVYLTLLSDRVARRGEPAEAFEWALAAHQNQLAADQGQVRLPRPGDRHVGWLDIDTLGRLYRRWYEWREAAGPDPELDELFRICMMAVESAKSRWFRRDVRQGLSTDAEGIIGYRPVHDSIEEGIDERLIARPDAPDENPSSPAILTIPEVAEAFPELRTAELRKHLRKGAALVSFYAARDRTYIQCVTPDRTLGFRIDMPLRSLNRAALALQAGFSGTGLYGRIDPANPFDLDDRLLQPVRDLGWFIQQLIPLVRDAPQILIAPHAAWHNIPIHALLLPPLWDTGRNPALTYVPSLGVAADLFRRATRRPFEPGRAAVVTAGRDPAEDTLFGDSHRRIVDTLHSAGLDIDQVRGHDATPGEVRSVLGQTDVLHVLSHGWYRDGAAAMDSGLALSPGSIGTGRSLLTGRDLLTEPISAGHITFHACSMGRVVLSAGDDQWGPVRAGLLGGADSVLAPQWDVDLHSSTELITRFYTSWLVDGLPKDQAFTQAQRDMYRAADGENALRHMYHWAAFKLTGV